MKRLSSLLLASCTAFAVAVDTPGGGGLAISPGLALVENVTPGQQIDLALSGLPIVVSNRSGGELAAELLPAQFVPYSLSAFECGFSYLPDVSWATVEPRELTLAPGAQLQGHLVVTIPDRPELWNRHWVVCVETGVPSRLALGAALRMQSRILIETAARAEVIPGGDLGVAPARLELPAFADGNRSGEVVVHSGSQISATYDVLTMAQVYPPALADRHARFFSAGVHALTSETWAVIEPQTFSLAPDGSQTLTVRGVHAPQSVSQITHEVRFIGRRAAPEADPKHGRVVAGQLYDRLELMRIIYSPATPGAPAP